MREIKFRAWDKEHELMFDVFGVDVNQVFPWQRENDPEIPIVPDREDCILMQYSGMKDKNGKEIYEGDIVYINITPSCERPIAKNCKVWYSEKDAAFMCDWHSGATHLGGFTPITVFEVIGNIYENPELL